MKNSKKKFSLSQRLETTKRGFEGFGNLLYYDPNAWIDIVAAIVVIAAGLEFGLTAIEWVAVSLAIGLVLATAAINIAIELIADTIASASEYQGLIKSLSAASLLIANISAIAIGVTIFTPKILMYE